MKLGEIFYWIFNMSITASISGLIILLLRKIKRLPKRCIKLLWAIPFIRLWIPIGISSKYSLMSLISKYVHKTVTVYFSNSDSRFVSTMNHVSWANSYYPITYKVNVLEDFFNIASHIWIIIAATVVLTLIVLYFLTVSEISDAVFYPRQKIYYSDKITSPAVFGIIRAKIVVPTSYANLDEQSMKYVLLHEKAHIRSFDNLLRVIAFITAALHWFNPLVWIFLKCFLSDIEYSCDEKVLSRVNNSTKNEYAEVLIKCAENSAVFVSAFGGAKLRSRVKHILSFKKISAVSAVAFGLLICAITYFLMTNSI